jgi:TetR/AcrR family transcriptional repressor of nem operon
VHPKEIMRYAPDHRQQTRDELLGAASREFRLRGYAGVGVDGLARAAGVTSGAFYKHFGCKADAFRWVARDLLLRLRNRVRRLQGERPADWLPALADFYLSQAHRDDVAGGCGVPGLSPEVARADPATRQAYAEALDEALGAMAQGAGLRETDSPRARALAVVSMMVGGMTLARAVPDGPLAAEILAAARAGVDRLLDSHAASTDSPASAD